MRATLKFDPVKRSWNKAQAIFTSAMREYARLPSATFDIRCVDSGLRVSVSAQCGGTTIPILLASFTTGTTWELNREKIQRFAPHVDVEAVQTFFE